MRGTKERIIRAAADLFAKHGMRRTSIHDIAKAAHVAKGALYYYFKSKEDVFAAVLRDELDKVWSKTQKAVKAEECPAKKIVAYLVIVTRESKNSILVHEAMNDDFLEHFETIERIRQETRKKEVDMLAEILEDGMSSGVFREMNIENVARAIVYAFEGLLCSPVAFDADIMGDDDRPGVVFALLLDGLRAR